MRRHLALVLVVGASLSAAAGAQADRPIRTATMARADSAYDRGERAKARELYAGVLAQDSTASRAVFRLAQLETSSARALALYRRYIALEPDDAWGHMAEGDLLARMGRLEDALVAYEGAHAVAPGERDVSLGRARLLGRAGRSHQAIQELTAWVTEHPDDGEAWDLLGRSRGRSGRPRAAAQAFERALQLRVAGAVTRLDAARAAAAPLITPDVASVGDSDGNRSTRIGGLLEAMVADGIRLGAGAHRHTIGDDIDEVRGTSVSASLAAVPSPAMRLSLEAGATRYGSSLASQETWTTFHAAARLRARAPLSGASIDLRAEHAPLEFSALLIVNQVQRSEARATIEVPFLGFRARGSGRVARIEARGEPPNRRGSLEGALMLPLGVMQPSVQYRVTGYERASTAGYFAPRQAETVEGGVYVEVGEDGPVSLSADAGGGVQRVIAHGGVPRPTPRGSGSAWSRTWRLWAQSALSLGPSRAWYVELEAYDAPFALDGAGSAGSWRSLAVSSGLRWSIR